ncbi:MAG: hypothetical protein LC667_02495 [Thioalkalivibrio sp.]|nr:hypothetical protein [Thioalkalivibrio sp.]
MRRSNHFEEIVEQMEENRRRHGGFSQHTPSEQLVVLMEEVGEIARALQEPGDGFYIWPPEYSDAVYRELVDAGAVILAMMEQCVDSCHAPVIGSPHE